MAKTDGVHVGDGIEQLVHNRLEILLFKQLNLVIGFGEGGVFVVLHDQVGLMLGGGNVQGLVFDDVGMGQSLNNVVGMLHNLNLLRLAFRPFHYISVGIILLHAFVDHPT